MKVYLASSWRNLQYPLVLAALRKAGHDVYDFRDPLHGFSWRDIDPNWPAWSAAQTRAAYEHELATRGLGRDFAAMNWADAIVMVQPCGRSSALELGWGIGAGKYTAVLMDDSSEPELMIGLAHRLCLSTDELIAALASKQAEMSYKDRCTRCDGAGKVVVETVRGPGKIVSYMRKCPRCAGGAGGRPARAVTR